MADKKKEFPKILLIFYVIIMVSIVAHDRYRNNPGPYPGNKSDHPECIMKWKANWFINTYHCNKHMSNPKFRVGEKVDILDNRLDDKCYGIVRGVEGYALSISMAEEEKISGRIGIVGYYVNVYCGEAIYKSSYLENVLTKRED